MIDHMILFSVV